MPPDLKARVKVAAEANNRSMNAEIVAALEEKYPDPTVVWVDELARKIMAKLAAGREPKATKARLTKVVEEFFAENPDAAEALERGRGRSS
ncbi:hypothetical protein BV379_00130 [Rhodovulum sulfidophilum]|nr:hypothetical protein BV379_00130 [Rhodovulum sulfidophilum]